MRLDSFIRGPRGPEAFLAGGGKVADIITQFDWSATPLGPIEHWPTSIKTVVGLSLRSPVPIVTLWGAQGTMIYNDAYSEFAAKRHPRLLGSAVREGWPEVADFNDNVMRVCLAGGTLSYQDQALTLLRKGVPEQVWMNLDYSPVIGEAGEPIGVIAIVVETSQSVLANARLRESEQRFRALTNASSNVIYRMSPDWREMRALDGRGFLIDTESPSISWSEQYLLPEDQASIRGEIERAINAKSTFELEHRVRRADGSIGWTLSRAIPACDERGDIVEWFGSASDVTEQHENESRLRFLDALGKETAKSTDADAILAVTTRMVGEHLGGHQLRLRRHGRGPGWLHDPRRLGGTRRQAHRRPLQTRRLRQAGGAKPARRQAADHQR